jgi:hypothetical protein
MTEAIKFSKMLAASSMVPKVFQGKPEDILVAVQWGSEVGLPAMSALQNIAVINGKPTIYGDAALALVTSHPQYGGHREWLKDEEAHCLIVRLVNGKSVETERTFSVGDAKRANLFSKPGPWKQYPKRMLQMRARGFAIRDAFPDAIKGVSIDESGTEIKDITPNPLDTEYSSPKMAEDEAKADFIAASEAVAGTKDGGGGIGPETADATPRAPDAVTEGNDWELLVNGEVSRFAHGDIWYAALLAALNEAANQTSHGDLVARRHDVSVIKKENEATIDRLLDEFPESGNAILDRYSQLIKAMSAKIEDEEGRP